jgi:hypothetical protein
MAGRFAFAVTAAVLLGGARAQTVSFTAPAVGSSSAIAGSYSGTAAGNSVSPRDRDVARALFA